MLLDRGLPELTGEAIILRHPRLFPRAAVEAARARLVATGPIDNAQGPVGVSPNAHVRFMGASCGSRRLTGNNLHQRNPS
jgi:hypothetical protein